MTDPQFYLTVENVFNQWQTGGSPGPNATVAKPVLQCNDVKATATIYASGDGFFTLENPTPAPLTYAVTLRYIGPGNVGSWAATSKVTVPAGSSGSAGKISVVRDAP